MSEKDSRDIIDILISYGITEERGQLFCLEYVKDLNPRRAALVSGFEPEQGAIIRSTPNISEAIRYLCKYRIQDVEIDSDWILGAAKELFYIALQTDKLSVAVSTLNLMAKHAKVDAFAAEKVEVLGADEVKERLLRARKRTSIIDGTCENLQKGISKL